MSISHLYGRSLQCKQFTTVTRKNWLPKNFSQVLACRPALLLPTIWVYEEKQNKKKTLKVCQHSIYNSITSLQTSCSASLTLHANSIKRRRGIKVCGWKWCEGHSVYPNNTWKNHDQKWLRNAGGRVICVGSKHCTGKHEPAVFTQGFCKNKKKYCILYSWPLLLHYI